MKTTCYDAENCIQKGGTAVQETCNKHKYSDMTTDYLQEVLNTMKKRHRLTATQIAEILQMSVRNCQDKLHGKHGFCGATVLTFLALIPEDYVLIVVRGYRKLILADRENEVLVHRNMQ